MDNQEDLDRLNQSAMDLVVAMGIRDGIDYSDPIHQKLIMLGITAGSIATFQYCQSDLEHRKT